VPLSFWYTAFQKQLKLLSVYADINLDFIDTTPEDAKYEVTCTKPKRIVVLKIQVF
jgi:hypothetical protein